MYQNTNTLPRAYIVPNAIVLPKDKILDKLKDVNFDVRKQIILQKKPNINLKNNSSFKEVKITHREPNKIQLETTLKESGFLVFSEIDYPGWKAYDNGKKLEIYNANYILRSIYLTQGDHNISLIYDPSSFKVGIAISSLTLLLSIAFLFYKGVFRLVDIKKNFL